MSLSDPIANMLTVIRNANRVKKDKVDIPASKLKMEIIKIFKNEGYIKNFKIIEEGRRSYIRIYLKYTTTGQSIIHNLMRISKPGLRVYRKKHDQIGNVRTNNPSWENIRDDLPGKQPDNQCIYT